MSLQLSEQEIVRRDALDKMRALGIDPYPAAKFVVNATTKEILANFDKDKLNFQEVSIAGRMMSKRIMGKASFAEIKDSTGRMQVYIARDEICDGEDKMMYNDVFKKLVDIGDFVGPLKF